VEPPPILALNHRATIDSNARFWVEFRMCRSPHLGGLCVSALSKADNFCVRLCVRSTRRTLFRRGAVVASWLGNGWIYLGFACVCTYVMGTEAISAIAGASASVGVLHCIYRPLKRWFSRPRPFDALPDLKPLLPVLDKHSFPSGHAMTLTAVLVAMPTTYPGAMVGYAALWMTMAWARIAVAHHYLSDVLAGSALALVISYPVSSLSNGLYRYFV
jgi:undecaprenyl-diphosphatase